jgi:hypothetical protein
VRGDAVENAPALVLAFGIRIAQINVSDKPAAHGKPRAVTSIAALITDGIVKEGLPCSDLSSSVA